MKFSSHLSTRRNFTFNFDNPLVIVEIKKRMKQVKCSQESEEEED